MLTEGLGDGTGFGIELVTVEAVGQVTGVRDCTGREDRGPQEWLHALCYWRGSGEMLNLCGQLSSPQIRQQRSLLGSENGAILPFRVSSQPEPSIPEGNLTSPSPSVPFFKRNIGLFGCVRS